MSSDLWSAFAGSSEDLSDNPWNQPSPQAESQRVSASGTAHATYKPTVTVLTRPRDTSDWAGTGTKNDNALKAPVSTNEVWPEHPIDSQNVWADLHAAIPELSLRSSRTAKHASAPPIAHQSLEPLGFIQDDDFGAFQEPSVQTPRTETLSTPITSNVKQNEHTGIVYKMDYSPNSRPSKGRSSRDYDPWGGLDLLEKPIQYLSEAKKQCSNEVFDKERCTDKLMPSLTEQSIELSGDAEDWGEFSPEPQSSSAFKDNVIPEGPVPIVAAATDRSRILPEPPTKDKLPVKAIETTPSRPSSSLPPTNVPPPSILISLTAGLVQKLPTQVEARISQIPTSKTTPRALDRALRGCLASLRVAGRIIAGRKYRWKRDSHLSQSMKIGPAQAGKPGGMKLTGVDKAEILREDREAAEFVRIWQQNLGSIRAVLATVNGQIEGNPLTLPGIAERMTLRTAKAEEGGIIAPKCCFLCGLKREERVLNIDSDVWDTLGEWWIEHWGHVECKTFWQEHEKFLQKRG